MVNSIFSGLFDNETIKTITGTGTINLSLNGNQIFVIDMGRNSQITIDTNLMEAYNPWNKNLLNRSVTGNYDNFKLNIAQ